MMSRRVVVLLVVSLFVDSAQCQNESIQLEKRRSCVKTGDYCNKNCCKGLVCVAYYKDYRCDTVRRCKSAPYACDDRCCGEHYCGIAYTGSKCMTKSCGLLGQPCNNNCCQGFVCSPDRKCTFPPHRCMFEGELCDNSLKCCQGLVCSLFSMDRRCVISPRDGVRLTHFMAGTRRNMAPCRLLAALVVFVWILH